jgi:hypothetical protein
LSALIEPFGRPAPGLRAFARLAINAFSVIRFVGGSYGQARKGRIIERFGFIGSPSDPFHLFVLIKDVWRIAGR